MRSVRGNAARHVADVVLKQLLHQPALEQHGAYRRGARQPLEERQALQHESQRTIVPTVAGRARLGGDRRIGHDCVGRLRPRSRGVHVSQQLGSRRLQRLHRLAERGVRCFRLLAVQHRHDGNLAVDLERTLPWQ